ncbi:MAG: hypothetical protein ABR512_04480 [Desulfopila sp.]
MPIFLRISTILLLVLLLLLPGCYSKSRRHLASDAGLIEVDRSSRHDVLTYLGEPDHQRRLSDTREEWLYVEEQPSELQRAPLVGGYFGGSGHEKVYIVLENDIVQSCRFRESGKDEFDWADDYDWQESEE